MVEEMIAALPAECPAGLDRRYASLTLDTPVIQFIDRIVAEP